MSIFGPTSAPSVPAVPLVEYKTIDWQNSSYAYEYYVVENSGNLSLIANYDAHLPVTKIHQDSGCIAAVSGGFYAQDNQPLGLVLADKTQVGRERISQLFNGFLAIDATGTAHISESYPPDARIILQSGPVLLDNSTSIKLSLIRDKLARRMVAATNQDHLVFLVIFNPQAEVLGPYLQDLPQLVEAISDKENLGLQNALNLDGGRASAFYSPQLTLAEFDPVGSVFCVK